MAKIIGNDFVRLYDDDAIELVLDDETYVQVFYTAKFSKVTLFGGDYRIVERVDFYKVVTLAEHGEVVNNDNSSDDNICYDYYKNIIFDIIFNKIDSYDYQKTYKVFSKEFYNGMIDI